MSNDVLRYGKYIFYFVGLCNTYYYVFITHYILHIIVQLSKCFVGESKNIVLLCLNNINFLTPIFEVQYVYSGGNAVTQLVEALRYKSEGRGFDSRRCH
jgi:hypothetical protein